MRCANWAASRRRSTPTGAPSNCGRLMPGRAPPPVSHRARAADGTDAAAAEAALLSAVRQNAARIPPFMLVATAATGADQLLCARKWVEHFAVPEQQIFVH